MINSTTTEFILLVKNFVSKVPLICIPFICLPIPRKMYIMRMSVCATVCKGDTEVEEGGREGERERDGGVKRKRKTLEARPQMEKGGESMNRAVAIEPGDTPREV